MYKIIYIWTYGQHGTNLLNLRMPCGGAIGRNATPLKASVLPTFPACIDEVLVDK